MLKNQKDFAAGLFYIAIGIFGATNLGDNEIGTLARMGPGYFPLIISTAIILTGLVIVVKSLGFVLSIGLRVVISSLAHPLFRLRDALISAVLLTTLSALLFIGGLGLIVPLWPTFL